MTKDLAPEHNSLYLRSQEYKDFGITSENNKISVHLKSTFLFRIMPLFWNIMCLMHFFTLVLPSYLPQVTDLTLSIPRAWTRLLRIFPKKGGSWACVKLNLERRGWKTEALMLEWSLVRLVFATARMLTWFIYSQLKNSMSWLPALCKNKAEWIRPFLREFTVRLGNGPWKSDNLPPVGLWYAGTWPRQPIGWTSLPAVVKREHRDMALISVSYTCSSKVSTAVVC